ncbi:MAG: right-handed parallel beta-helix repeat-containing protein [Firmicutes bacterium]|nr:right-handed parallel beta-helix repeat-containing protein [Bacillota bacterium]MCL2256494.1 right-handed parallel beta-helix repeat-containing protein [Bacillota bacterium]
MSKIITNNFSDCGATVPFTTYLAKDFKHNGKMLSKSRVYRTLTSECVGREAVELSKTGQFISLKMTKPMNAVSVRYSIPDEGHNTTISNVPAFETTLTLYVGKDKYVLPMNTAHSHLYGDFSWSKDREKLGEHKFFDEVSLKLDKTYPEGTKLVLKKEADNSSPYYAINLIDIEVVPEALKPSDGAINAKDYGLVNDGKTCNYEAFLNAYKDAVKSEKRELFIPEGEYYASKIVEINDDNVTISGSGIWQSVLKGEICFRVTGKNVQFRNFKMDGNMTVRRDVLDQGAIETQRGAEKLIMKNLWIVHHKVGAWVNYASHTLMEGCRCRDLYADGINLHWGVKNSVIRNNSFRATGDDGIAMWSEGEENDGNLIEFNTVEAPWLANCIAMYGGKNATIRNNYVCDTVYAGAGIDISSGFKPTPFGGTIVVENNVLVRCGSKRESSDLGAIWFKTVKDYDNRAKVILKNNTVLDSTYQGIFIEGGGLLDGLKVIENNFDGMETHFVDCVDDAKNKVVFENNTVKNFKHMKFNNPLGMGLTKEDLK